MHSHITHFIYLAIFFCLFSCQNESTSSGDNDSNQEVVTTDVPVENTTAPCQYLPEQKVRTIFNIANDAKLEMDEEVKEAYHYCLYTFEEGFFSITKHLNIPPPFKGNNEAYLDRIFKLAEEDGTQKRPGFERLDGLGFNAGWTPSNNKALGNTIDFVIDNKRYSIQVKYVPNDSEKSKEKAVELAKLLKS